jgi:hypothetical protein
MSRGGQCTSNQGFTTNGKQTHAEQQKKKIHHD